MAEPAVVTITIGDEPFKISYMEYDVDRYEEFLATKIETVLSKLPNLMTSQMKHIEIIRSPTKHFRQRCRFAISTSLQTSNLDCQDTIGDTQLNVKSPTTDMEDTGPQLSYSLWDYGGPNILVAKFPIASIAIYNAMPILLKYIQAVKELRTDLRAINFLSSLSGELIASLVYERHIDLNWEKEAKSMFKKLGALDHNWFLVMVCDFNLLDRTILCWCVVLFF